MTNQPSTNQQKWFYPAQKEAMKNLDKIYNHISCNWQVFSSERIIESYTCQTLDVSKFTLIEVHYRVIGNNVQTTMYDLTSAGSSIKVFPNELKN